MIANATVKRLRSRCILAEDSLDTLFRKALVFADPHFGRSGNSPQAHQDNIEYLRWAIEVALTWGAETCIMLGDWHDNRHSIAVSTMLASLDGMDMLNAAFGRVWWLPGNHDLLYRGRRDAASIEFARWLPNVTIVREPISIGGVSLVPWLVQDEHQTLTLGKDRYAFLHAETVGFWRNAMSVMPESPHALTTAQFVNQDYAFSGHFHKRQIQKNCCYIGNIFPFNFTDDGDVDRGLMLLEWGKEPIFHAWPQQPLYRSIKLSELLNTIDTVLKPNMTVRLSIDLPLSYEETAEMRTGLVSAYGLRKIELHHVRDEVDQDEQIDVAIQTVDQIVLSGLENIESVGLSNSRLTEIYQGLIS